MCLDGAKQILDMCVVECAFTVNIYLMRKNLLFTLVFVDVFISRMAH
jgi:hypothetical protein